MRKIDIQAIATVGQIGSGKDTAIEYISEKNGIPMVSIGKMVADLALQANVKPTRDNLHRIAKKLLELYGSEYFSNKVLKKIETHSCGFVAIAGVRLRKNIVVFKKLFKKFLVLYIKTDKPEVRFERLKKRKELRDPKNFEEFLIQDNREEKMFDLEETFKMADIVVENNGTLEELYQKLDALICREFPTLLEHTKKVKN